MPAHGGTGALSAALGPVQRAGQHPSRSARAVNGDGPRPDAGRLQPTRGRRPGAGGAWPPRASDSAANPAVIAHANASPTPTTSSRPKPRTIGTGEMPSTRKPAAVAPQAVAIDGPGQRRRPGCGTSWRQRLFSRHLVEARLQLDRVVDAQTDQDRQHRDRGHRQRRAHQRHASEQHAGGSQRQRQRKQALAAAEHQRQRQRHHQHDADQQHQDGARDRRRHVGHQHRGAGDRVGALPAQAEGGQPHDLAHQRDRAIALGSVRSGRRRAWIRALRRLGRM